MKAYSETQHEFKTYIEDVFRKEFPFEETSSRLCLSAPEAEAALQELSLEEYFLENDGSLRELGIVAFESGRSLLCSAPAERILCKQSFGTSLKEAPSLCVGIFDWSISSTHPAKSTAIVSGDLGESETSVVFVGEATDGSAALNIASEKLKPVQAFDLSRQYYSVDLEDIDFGKAEIEEGNKVPLRAKLQLAHAAELAGLCAQTVDVTVEYVKTRKQFGVAVGGFQAVQHKIADMYLVSEAALAGADFAAALVDEGDTDQAGVAIHAALRYAAKNVAKAIETAVQVHGGIGFTWEYPLHYFLRRSVSLARMYQPIFKDSTFLSDHFAAE